eukprot:UN24123
MWWKAIILVNVSYNGDSRLRPSQRFQIFNFPYPKKQFLTL